MYKRQQSQLWAVLIPFLNNRERSNMRSALSCFLGILLLASHIEAQHGFGYYYYNPYYYHYQQAAVESVPSYFRSGLSPQSSLETFKNPESSDDDGDGRFFLGQLTLTLASSTSTTTVTSTTVCTTSTSALKVCTPSGRRRRGMSFRDNKGLYYYDQEEEGEDGNIFLPSPPNKK